MVKQCQLCEDTTATLFCKQCNESFCSEVHGAQASTIAVMGKLWIRAADCDCVIIHENFRKDRRERCFEALHWSGKRQGHEVFPVGDAQAQQASSVPPPPPPAVRAPISPPKPPAATLAATPVSQVGQRPTQVAGSSAPPGVPIGGVGLFLKPNERQELEIVRLAKGGSAERSGQILPGDIVFEVDGEDVYKKDFNVFAKLIQGPVGTFVEVKVFKQGDYSRVNQVVLERTLNPEDSRPPQAGSPQVATMAPSGAEPPRPAAPMPARQPGLSSSLSGAGDIGVDFKTDETGCFQITGLKPGGPAQQSGLVEIGDILYEIEGVKVLYGIGPNGRPLSNIEITEMLRGPEGSVMNLRLQKGRMGRLATVNLTRTAMSAQPPRGGVTSTLISQPVQPAAPPPPPAGGGSPPSPPQLQPPQQQHSAIRVITQPRSPVQQPPPPPPQQHQPPPPQQQMQPRLPQAPPPPPPPAQQAVPPVQPQQMQSSPLQNYQQPPNQQQTPQQPGTMGSLYGTNQSGMQTNFNDLYGPPPESMEQPIMYQHPNGMMMPHHPMAQPGQWNQFAPPPMQYQQPDYVDKYNPTQPDRFGLGIVFQPYGQGQIRVKSLVPGGPAELSGEPIDVGDWLYEIDGKMVFKQPITRTMKLLQAKQKGDPVHLGLRKSGDRHLTGVMILKGNTGVKLANAGVGLVFKTDAPPNHWVRVAQVVPYGPALLSVGDSVIRVNDRIMEVNGTDVAQKDIKTWQHLLRGKEGSSCVLTLADVNAELYTVNIIRGYVDQGTVDQKCVNVPAPMIEAPVKIAPKYVAPEKKIYPNISGVSCGISFTTNAEGEVVVDHVTKGGPAAQVGQITPGDVILEIGDGPDGPAVGQPFSHPNREVYRQPVPHWEKVIKQGVPQTHCKFLFRKGSNPDEKYEVLVKRELLVDMESGKEKLYTVGLKFASHGKKIYVDAEGVVAGSSAAKEGIQGRYILQAIEREDMTGRVDDLQSRMNELLIGPKNSQVSMIFLTSAGSLAFRVLRDVPLHNAETAEAPKPRVKIQPPKPAPQILPFDTSKLAPGGGIYTQPMCNPVLWASLIEEGQAMDGDDSKFQWRGRILMQPYYDENHIATITDAYTNELIYRGPGDKEQRLPGMKLPSSRRRPDGTTASAPPQSAPPQQQQSPAPPQQQQSPAPPQQQSPPRQPSPPPAAPQPPSPEAARSPTPPPPAPAAAAPPPPPAGGGGGSVDMDDDEATLVLTDGKTVEAKKLEEILKRHLDAVAYVMVVGSKRPFLSCMLTLKTHGSEAAAEGKDPRSVETPYELAEPALALAKKVGSSAVNVQQARQDTLFRANGLLPGFSAANVEIADNAMQVRRFSILTSFFTQATGELKPDGTLDRLKIKRTHKHIIEGMYQQKKPPGAAGGPAPPAAS